MNSYESKLLIALNLANARHAAYRWGTSLGFAFFVCNSDGTS